MKLTRSTALTFSFVAAFAASLAACEISADDVAGDPAAQDPDQPGSPADPGTTSDASSSTSSATSGAGGSGSSSSSSSSGTGGKGGGGAPPMVDEHPAWLVGLAYTKGYKEENNVYFESEDAGIRFNAGPSYGYDEKIGKTWSKAGSWKVGDGKLVLTSGAGTKSALLSAAMIANCRVLDLPWKSRLWIGGAVAACPFKTPLTAEECAKAGSYSHTSETQSGSGDYYTSSSYTTSYQLDPDGFISYETSSFKFTCYGANCKDLSNHSAPTVGRWWLKNGAVVSDALTVNLSGMTFAKSKATCVQ